ncbi:hypothetical protein PAXRUDRAFT_21815 [Paxillus rubicundulus Ve08.2h10]|uniref:Uncharacterized protein n=1 Tax=Paxillus rubicundulus Ve08.2h10 TaxID=930991 RepID=A0A0D0BLP2_9AGAM|nr:hypothetical protein PAXRUDRAFT_21815 [Paxillus rubicundulus Ve08.2h10]
MIAEYQWGVNKVMGGLTQEEMKEAERLAEEWRKAKPPAKVQAKTASQKGEKYLKEFAEEMWKQYDINDQIEDGEALNGWGGAHQRWMEYAKKALGDPASDEEESPTDTNSNLDSSPVEGKKTKVDAVSMRSDYISGKYLPQGAKLWEPSKLRKKEVISLLEFWRDRQRSDLADIFTFQKWRDATGTLQDPVEVDSDEEGASQRRTAAKGKRKAAPDHWLMDTEESKDDQGGLTDKETQYF